MKNTHIIAELAWGHDGKIDQAIELMKKAKESGADSFSIHLTDLPNYMVTYYGNGEGKVSAGREDLEVYKYLEDINPTNEQWENLAEVAKEINIELCVMPNDIQSLEFSEAKLNPEYYVVSPACFAELDMVEAIAKTGKKTLFRIGGSYLAEIEKVVNIFRANGNNNIILLHGFQNYPTKLEETDMSLLGTLKNTFNVEVGLADHIDGGDKLAKIIPMLALPYGATYIEKHITLNREDKSEDFESALNPDDFKEFVENIRATEIALGTPYFKDLNEATLRYRQIVRKRLVAAVEIKEGEIITAEKIIAKRCDVGLTPDNKELIIGRVAKKDIIKDEALMVEKFI
jgi:sialic acid synthase SpsE